MSDETRVIEIAGQTVTVACDPDACVWRVHSSTVPGHVSEAVSAPELIEELQVTVRAISLP